MRRPAVALTASSLAFALVLLDTTVVNVALPAIRDDLGTSVGGLQWVVNGYTLVLAALLLSAGALADRLGARRMMRAGVAIFAVASAAAALAPSTDDARRRPGPARRRRRRACPRVADPALPRVPGPDPARESCRVWAAISASAFAAGPVLGGLLVDAVGWRLVFAINLPFAAAIALLAVGAAWRDLPRRPPRARPGGPGHRDRRARLADVRAHREPVARLGFAPRRRRARARRRRRRGVRRGRAPRPRAHAAARALLIARLLRLDGGRLAHQLRALRRVLPALAVLPGRPRPVGARDRPRLPAPAARLRAGGHPGRPARRADRPALAAGDRRRAGGRRRFLLCSGAGPTRRTPTSSSH